MILTVVTYQMYIGRSRERADIVGREFERVDSNRNRRIETAEYNIFVKSKEESRDEPSKRE